MFLTDTTRSGHDESPLILMAATAGSLEAGLDLDGVSSAALKTAEMTRMCLD